MQYNQKPPFRDNSSRERANISEHITTACVPSSIGWSLLGPSIPGAEDQVRETGHSEVPRQARQSYRRDGREGEVQADVSGGREKQRQKNSALWVGCCLAREADGQDVIEVVGWSE